MDQVLTPIPHCRPLQVVMKGADGAVAEAYLFGGVVTSWKARELLICLPAEPRC